MLNDINKSDSVAYCISYIILNYGVYNTSTLAVYS